MKKRFAIASVLALTAALCVVGCNYANVQELKTYHVTFVQTGQDDIVREVQEGGSLSSVPSPASKTGYTVTWDRTDFTNITGNLTVNAVETANEYTITYNPGEGTIESLTQKVTYDSSYTLSTATSTNDLSDFLYWKRADGTSVSQSGVWKIAEDVTLTAVYSDVYTVAFVQTGQEAILKQVGQNGTLTDIPEPSSKTGYTVTWDRTDFTNITGNLTVNAVEAAKTYILKLNAQSGTVSEKTITVTYDQVYELPEAVSADYKFVGWMYDGELVALNGIWKIDADKSIELSAKWDDSMWSGFY